MQNQTAEVKKKKVCGVGKDTKITNMIKVIRDWKMKQEEKSSLIGSY